MDTQDTMNRYSSQYEANLDPFAAFGAKEKQRRYTRLSGPDKATLVLVRIHVMLTNVYRFVYLYICNTCSLQYKYIEVLNY